MVKAVATTCGCTLRVNHTLGDRMVSCSHRSWVVRVQPVNEVEYRVFPWNDDLKRIESAPTGEG